MFGELGIVFITSQTNKLEFVEVQLMKIKNPMLVVTDIDKSVEFYKKVFGLTAWEGGYFETVKQIPNRHSRPLLPTEP